MPPGASLEGRVDVLESKVADLRQTVYGDGDGSNSMRTVMAMQACAIKKLESTVGELRTAVTELPKALGETLRARWSFRSKITVTLITTLGALLSALGVAWLGRPDPPAPQAQHQPAAPAAEARRTAP
jgi:hypothetical protein